MVGMNIIAQFWLEVVIVLRDIEGRIKELEDHNMLDIKIQGLYREWKEVAKDYKAYSTAVCAVHS